MNNGPEELSSSEHAGFNHASKIIDALSQTDREKTPETSVRFIGVRHTQEAAQAAAKEIGSAQIVALEVVGYSNEEERRKDQARFNAMAQGDSSDLWADEDYRPNAFSLELARHLIGSKKEFVLIDVNESHEKEDEDIDAEVIRSLILRDKYEMRTPIMAKLMNEYAQAHGAVNRYREDVVTGQLNDIFAMPRLEELATLPLSRDPPTPDHFMPSPLEKTSELQEHLSIIRLLVVTFTLTPLSKSQDRPYSVIRSRSQCCD